jgi:hypothetical protein
MFAVPSCMLYEGVNDTTKICSLNILHTVVGLQE